jgi:hypothetical protein
VIDFKVFLKWIPWFLGFNQIIQFNIMEIQIITDSNVALMNGIIYAVKKEIVKIWVTRQDIIGNTYLTYKPAEWYDKALIGFKLERNKLIIPILWPGDNEPSEEVKDFYAERFTDILAVYFRNRYDSFEIIK